MRQEAWEGWGEGGASCGWRVWSHAGAPTPRSPLPPLLHAVLAEDFRDFWRYFAREVKAPLAGRDIIVGSVCPQLHGLYQVKLSLLLTLIGGVPVSLREKDDKGRETGAITTRTRGDSHILLVGDPGTGKSQFLQVRAGGGRRGPRAVRVPPSPPTRTEPPPPLPSSPTASCPAPS